MLALSQVPVWLVCFAAGNVPRTDPFVSPAVYEIVTSAAVEALPEPLRSFFATNLPKLQNGAAATGDGDDKDLNDPSAHFIFLDAGARAGSQERQEAARRFPQGRRAAAKLFKRLGIADGGSLPWTLLHRHDELVRAWKGRDSATIIVQTARLLHFATDAAIPHKTTGIGRDGGAGRERARKKNPSETQSRANSAQTKCFSQAVEQARQRWAYEVRVWPGRVEAPDEPVVPIDAVFRTLIQTHAQIREDGEPALSCDGLVRTQLEAGALLGARLILSSWAEAGKPEASAFTPFANDKRSGRSAARPTGLFAGSRHSTVFHRADCRHTKRIKPENRVSFRTAADAIAEGRVPCKVCKPGG